MGQPWHKASCGDAGRDRKDENKKTNDHATDSSMGADTHPHHPSPALMAKSLQL